MISVNLFGSEVDIERVNIARNYDMPKDTDTYLHHAAKTEYFEIKYDSFF